MEEQEADLKERKERLENNEIDFEKLTKRLESQSEELIQQKIEYNKKVESFNISVEKFKRDKDELN